MKFTKVILFSFVACAIVLFGIILPTQILPYDMGSDKLCSEYSNQDKTEMKINSNGDKEVKIENKWYNIEEVTQSCMSK